jgi:hypothetical protein
VNDLLYIKPIYAELLSQRSLDLYQECLKNSGTNSYTRQTIYSLLSMLIKKHLDNEKHGSGGSQIKETNKNKMFESDEEEEALHKNEG